ncbi:hypothetical protein LTR17_011390 [Elasticomyces elasticus]|nr:hypothetical protein LTR17_011390 [Elasticomyces elasticus]
MTSTSRSMPKVKLDAGLMTTSTDHRGWLWVTTILPVIYTIIVLIARLFGKYGLLWYDNVTMRLAYVRNSCSSSNAVRLMRERSVSQLFVWTSDCGRPIAHDIDGLGANLTIANLLPNSQKIELVGPIEFMKHGTDEHFANGIMPQDHLR